MRLRVHVCTHNISSLYQWQVLLILHPSVPGSRQLGYCGSAFLFSLSLVAGAVLSNDCRPLRSSDRCSEYDESEFSPSLSRLPLLHQTLPAQRQWLDQ